VAKIGLKGKKNSVTALSEQTVIQNCTIHFGKLNYFQ